MPGVALGADDTRSPHLQDLAGDGHLGLRPCRHDDRAVERAPLPDDALDIRVHDLRQPGCLHEEIGPHAIGELQHPVREVLLERVDGVIGADLQGQLGAILLGLGDDDLGGARLLEDRAGGDPHRPTAEDDDPVARADAAAALDHGVVRHAGGFHQASCQEEVIALIDTGQRLQAPHRSGGHDDVLCKGTVDVEPDLVQPLAVVGISVSARLAHAAPQHLLRRDPLTALEGLVRALVERLLSGLDDDSGELVAQNAGEPGQTRIEYVALVVGLGHMDVRAADAAGLHLHQHLVWPRGGDVIFPDLEPGISPRQAAQVGLFPVDVLRPQFEPRLGVPLRDQRHALHFVCHCQSSSRVSMESERSSCCSVKHVLHVACYVRASRRETGNTFLRRNR